MASVGQQNVEIGPENRANNNLTLNMVFVYACTRTLSHLRFYKFMNDEPKFHKIMNEIQSKGKRNLARYWNVHLPSFVKTFHSYA